jgi:hypothetical protein
LPSTKENKMKHLKMLGLVAGVAMALVALAGGGTASATTLFTDPAKTTHYASGTEIQTTLTKGTSAIFTGSGGEVLNTCTSSTITGKTTSTSGTLLGIVLSTFTLTCGKTTHTVSNGVMSIEWTSGTSGAVRGQASEVTIDGIFGVSCTYGTGTGTRLGTITGGIEAKLNIAAVGLVKTAGSFLCPSSAGWDAEYTLTKPHSLYVGA